MFDNFHNTYLRIFYSCFFKKIIPVKEKENTWMTRGIMVSINHKRELYLNSKCSNDRGLKDFYKLYCKIVTRVIREAKQQQFSRRISTSKNKIITTWNIFKSDTEI
jgi:hypothetical protein